MKFYIFWRMKPEIIQATDRLALPYPLIDLEKFKDLNEVIKFVDDLKKNENIDKIIIIPFMEGIADFIFPFSDEIIVKGRIEKEEEIHIIKEIKI